MNDCQTIVLQGTSYHWDMLVVGCLNIPLSIFCMPWMHAVLPHSPLHVRALADIDEHVEEGHVYDIIVKVGEGDFAVSVQAFLSGERDESQQPDVQHSHWSLSQSDT